MIRRLLAAVIGAVFVITACAGCSGSSRSEAAARAAFSSIVAHNTPGHPVPRPADYLADQILQYSAATFRKTPSEEITMSLLDWSGNSGTSTGARIDLKIKARVFAHTAVNVGDTSYEAESTTRCFRLTLFGTRNNDTHRESDISCPAGVAPKTPTPNPLPSLDATSLSTLQAALTSASSGTLAGDIRRAFPNKTFSIDTRATAGSLVAAVGLTDERQCIAGSRTADGVVTVSTYSGADIEPGETGCRVELILNPVVAH